MEESKKRRGAIPEPIEPLKPLSERGEERHYLIDRVTGAITFGNGKKGAVPPSGTGNVKAAYEVGKNCVNCGAAMPLTAKCCPNCGQANP